MFLYIQNVNQFTCTGCVPDNHEVHISLHNCGSSVWKFLPVSPLTPSIMSWFPDFWILVDPCSHPWERKRNKIPA